MIRRIRNNDFIRVLALMGNRLMGYFAVLFPYALVEVLCQNMVMAFVMRDALNAAYTGNIQLVLRSLEVALAAFFLGQPLYWFLNYLSNAQIIRTMTAVQIAAFKKVTHLPLRRFEQEHSGSILVRLTENFESINLIYERLLPVVVFHFGYSSLALSFVFYFDWRMGLIILALSLGNILIGKAFQTPIQKAGDCYQEKLSVWSAGFLDSVQGVIVTKLFHAYHMMLDRLKDKSQAVSREYIRQGDLAILSEGVHTLYSNLRYIILLGIGLLLVMSGKLDLGSVGAFLFMPGWASLFFESIGRVISRGQEFLAGARRVFDLHDWPSEEEEHATGRETRKATKKSDLALEVNKLRFVYDVQGETTLPALDEIDLAVARGRVAALVGPMGSGKSTLVKLLMGMYPLQNGEIQVLGNPSTDFLLAELRQQFAYVPQDAHLFAGSIEENIRYGNPDAPAEAVIEAARKAHAHEFILSRPEGYDTQVGEHGASLSGGERQRIAIARAILRDAPILLLDEATSALDSESEQIVQEAIRELMTGRTTIAIAHRLSTIEDADIIYVFEDGRVIETGTHKDLLEQKGLYHRLVQYQSGEQS